METVSGMGEKVKGGSEHSEGGTGAERGVGKGKGVK